MIKKIDDLFDKFKKDLDEMKKDISGSKLKGGPKDFPFPFAVIRKGEIPKDLGKIIDEVAQKIFKKNSEAQEGKEEKTVCYCSRCLRYDNFEEVLKDKLNEISYAEFEIGPKKFYAKFWKNDEEEHLVLSDNKETSSGNTYPANEAPTMEDLLAVRAMGSTLLKEALDKQDLTIAQEILVELSLLDEKINELNSKISKNS